MLIRVQHRRGTSTEWSSTNPILAGGEFGVEEDTGKFKLGNGISNWNALEYFSNTNSIKSDLVDSAPATLNTLNELAAAINDDASFSTTVLNAIAAKASTASPTFTGTVDFSGATVSGVMLPINWMGAYSNAETYVENDMVHYSGSVYYATGPNLNNAQGYYPTAAGSDWELFASKGDTGGTGAPGPQGPAGTLSDLTWNTGPASGSTYTIQASDRDKVLVSGASPLTITIANILSPGQSMHFQQGDITQISFVPGPGVTLHSAGNKLKTRQRYSGVSLMCESAGVYWLVGDTSL